MSAVTEKTTSPITFDIQVVQTVVAQSTLNVAKKMMVALMAGLQEKLSFKDLAAKQINPKLDEELAGADEKTQMAYQKLFAAAFENATTVSKQFLGTTLLTIATDTHDDDAPRKFLGSFVLPETREMITKLQEQAPASLECKEIWE